jgi:PPOX class probable F420-dependent enzyme
MTDLSDFARVAAGDHNYCVVASTRADGTVQASVVTAGVMPHPQVGRGDVVAFVAIGGSKKLANWRQRPAITVIARAGGNWACVEGHVHLIGPDDATTGVDDERLRELLREVFVGAGGTHDDWDTYDRVMREQRRTVVLVTPARVYANG